MMKCIEYKFENKMKHIICTINKCQSSLKYIKKRNKHTNLRKVHVSVQLPNEPSQLEKALLTTKRKIEQLIHLEDITSLTLSVLQTQLKNCKSELEKIKSYHINL